MVPVGYLPIIQIPPHLLQMSYNTITFPISLSESDCDDIMKFASKISLESAMTHAYSTAQAERLPCSMLRRLVSCAPGLSLQLTPTLVL